MSKLISNLHAAIMLLARISLMTFAARQRDRRRITLRQCPAKRYNTRLIGLECKMECKKDNHDSD